ncbi:MAG: helical backbone metal receptor [Gemmatimonadaceae bacterium]
MPVLYFSTLSSRAKRGTCSWPSVVALAFALATSACTRDAAPARTALTDDFGDTLVVGAAPRRIVSLNPTTTELLFAIGAGPRVTGRTSYDIYPKEVLAVPDLGQGLRPNVEAVLSTRPDLVLLYASADNRDAARRLRRGGVATAAYKIDRIADMMRVTRILGRLTGDSAAADRTVDSVRVTLDRVRTRAANLPHPTVFWPLWEAPLLSVGAGSFLDELLGIAGAKNIFGDLPQPSPTVAFEELLKRDPDLILASAKSRDRMLVDPRWKTLRAVREGRVVVFDSAIVTGPSTRVGASAVSLARLLHPGVAF